ncbi:MAG: glutamate racemase [Sedimenticola sp.]|nr:glutamate racemase [Sedimenticola sp.]
MSQGLSKVNTAGMMTDLDSNAPIGVFDSGWGGLSVLGHIQQHLPSESYIYVADTGHLPYGPKSPGYVIGRAERIAAFLLERGAKALVVACNTATAAAIAVLRESLTIPVIGIEPGVKPALAQSHSGTVGVLATEGTLGSEKFRRLISQHGQLGRVIVQPCHGWVELVEQGALDTPQAYRLVAEPVGSLLSQGADTLVLGCTHYPFLSSLIRQVAGPDVLIIDTGQAIAQELHRRLSQARLVRESQGSGQVEYWVSGDPEAVKGAIQPLLGTPLLARQLPPQWR